MIFRESETVELKEIVVDDIKKEIIAFANCEGGKLYIGVQDDGTVIGTTLLYSQERLATGRRLRPARLFFRTGYGYGNPKND